MMNNTLKKARRMATMILTAAVLTIPATFSANAAEMVNCYGPEVTYTSYTTTDYSATNASTTGTYMVYDTDKYLALRNGTSYNRSNEIGRIFNGDTVQVIDVSTGSTGYVYVYSPTLGMYGYVNKSYLTPVSTHTTTTGETKYVTGTTNYLALRNGTSYNKSNEIGRIFNGDTVQVIDSSMGSTGYVYVYSPTLNMYGYVNKSYLTSGTTHNVQSSQTKTVRNTTNYLALRNGTTYSRSNEIGRIYNGDTVQLVDSSMSNTGYVYVYSPTLGKYGYVNKDYLF